MTNVPDYDEEPVGVGVSNGDDRCRGRRAPAQAARPDRTGKPRKSS